MTINQQTNTGKNILVQVVVIQVIALPQKNQMTSDIHDLPYLKYLKLARPITSDEQFQISLLTSADHFMGCFGKQYNSGSWTYRRQVKDWLMLSGPFNPCSSTLQLNTTVLKAIVTREREEKSLDRFWNLESIGILPNETEKEKKRVCQRSPRLFNSTRKCTLQCKVALET